MYIYIYMYITENTVVRSVVSPVFSVLVLNTLFLSNVSVKRKTAESTFLSPLFKYCTKGGGHPCTVH